MQSKYIKIQNISKNTNSIECPECKEKLLHVDIEMFNKCPYCDHTFPETIEFEDFILQPIIDEWVRFTAKHNDLSNKDRINLQK